MNKVNHYIENLLAQYSSRNVNAFIDTAAEDMSSIYLSKVELEGESEEVSGFDDNTGEGEEEEEEELELSSITSVIAEENRLVVLGNPGSGKTTVLIHELVRLCKSFLEGNSKVLPIFVSLKELRADYTLADFLDGILSSDELANYVKIGNSVLFLDGLNEVVPDLYDSTIKNIKDIMTAFPLLRLVISSRKYGYSNQLGIAQYEIQAFDESDIQEYTVRRTGNIDLFNVLRQRKLLHTLASTPLMLKMIADIWSHSQQLPAQFSSLYEEFIDYQLHKSLSISSEEKDCLLDVYANLAFELRNIGYISDSVEHLEEIISSYVPAEKCEEVADELLKSGLLVINSMGHGFDYVSFIHETFQEYFCSLFIAHSYMKDHQFKIDVTDSKWKETVKLSLEMVLPHLSKNETGILLDYLRHAFYDKSANHLVDEHLEEFVAILSNTYAQSEIVTRYVEQYVSLNMSNYIGLNHSKGKVHLFGVIVKSVVKLPSTNLMKCLFEDKAWLNQWLFGGDDLDEECSINKRKEVTRKNKYRILLHAICNSTSPKDWFSEILLALRQYGYSYVLGNRLRHMVSQVVKFLSNADLKEMYLQNGQVFCLLLSMDAEFIKGELSKTGASLGDIVGPYQTLIGRKYSSTKNLRTLSFYYNFIVPRYEDELFDTKQLLLDIMNCPGLLDNMIDNAYWLEHFTYLAKMVYVLPEMYWGKMYSQLISKRLLMVDPFLATHAVANYKQVSLNCFLEKGGKYYYSMANAKFSKVTEVADDIKSANPDVSVEVKNIGVLEVMDNLRLPEDCRGFGTLDDLISKYPLLNVVEEKGHSKLYFDIPVLMGSTFSKERLQIRGYVYQVKRSRAICIFTSLKLDHWEYIHETKKQSIKKERMQCSYFLMHRDYLLSKMMKLNSFSESDLATWGILGYFPNKLEKVITSGCCKLYYMSGKAKNKYYLVGKNSNEMLNLSMSYYDVWEVGDIILYYNDCYYKIHDTNRLSIYGYHEGVVWNKDGDEIQIKDSSSHELCEAYDKNNSYKLGDKVSFWPSGIKKGYHHVAYSICNQERV